MILMPFTPFHLGPGLALGLALRKWLHPPTFIIANVVLDVEPFLVIVLGLEGPLHGISHTFIFAAVAGAVCGGVMKMLEGRLGGLFRALRIEGAGQGASTGIKAFIVSGIAGCTLHVLFDAPLYADIRPLFPLEVNPLYSVVSGTMVYIMCIVLGLAGLAIYGMVLFSDRGKARQ